MPTFVEVVNDEASEGVRLTGVLNSPVSGGAVQLTTLGIARLQNSASDVKTLLNYERHSGAVITGATYADGKITVSYEYGGAKTLQVVVEDVTASKAVANSTHESKAQNLENNATFPQYGVVLAGSSSMEKWTTSQADMAPATTINVGIGGTRVDDWLNGLAERLIFPYQPRAVVLYVGVNDIKYVAENGGDLQSAGAQTGAKLQTLFDFLHERLPQTTIYFVLVNQIPLAYSNGQGNNYVAQIDAANDVVETYAQGKAWMQLVDAGKNLVNASGKAISSYFK